jgi:excinuclease ABC subunit A
MLEELSHQGFLRARIDGEVIYLDNMDELDGKIHHTCRAYADSDST